MNKDREILNLPQSPTSDSLRDSGYVGQHTGSPHHVPCALMLEKHLLLHTLEAWPPLCWASPECSCRASSACAHAPQRLCNKSAVPLAEVTGGSKRMRNPDRRGKAHPSTPPALCFTYLCGVKRGKSLILLPVPNPLTMFLPQLTSS